MSTPPLQRHADRFEERNSFIFALLGVVSWARDPSLLKGVADAKPVLQEFGEPSSTVVSAETAQADQDLVDGLLGLVRLERTAAGIILSWAEQAIVPNTMPRATHVEGLLR